MENVITYLTNYWMQRNVYEELILIWLALVYMMLFIWVFIWTKTGRNILKSISSWILFIIVILPFYSISIIAKHLSILLYRMCRKFAILINKI